MPASIRGSYSSPVVVGYTPWSKARIESPGFRSDFPPDVDRARLDLYADFEALVENRPYDVFPDLAIKELGALGLDEGKVLVALGLPELLCNVWADSLYSDPPSIEFRDDSTRDIWDAIWRANGGDEELGWESVFSAAQFGTSVLRLRVDEQHPPDETLDRGGDVVIEEVPASIYFPVLRTGSSRDVELVVLAWEEDRSDPLTEQSADIWQVRETYRLEGEQLVVEYRERRAGADAGWSVAAPDDRPDGVSFLPFVDLHARRGVRRFWGVSELSRNLTIFNELDARLSAIAEVLDYHGAPILQVPSSVLFGNTLYKGADRAIGIRRPEDAEIARYVTWDGMIDSQLAAIDKALELAMLTAEVPPGYFGIVEGGSWSGTALKLRLQQYLKKAGRYQRKEDSRLRRLSDYALRLAGVDEAARTIRKVTLGSPLPADDLEDSQIEAGLVTAGLSSKRTSITRLRRVDDVDEELKQIADEEQTSSTSGAGLPAPAGLPTGAAPAGLVPPAATATGPGGATEQGT